MRHYPFKSGRSKEQGLIITLVAIFTLFVVGAMAAIAIDLTSLYNARSEAQLAADAGALAGARALANSGMTSSTDVNMAGDAQSLCAAVSSLVAQSNLVGGVAPTVTANTCSISPQNNPLVKVSVQANMPTFFARIWRNTPVSISASATAEAFNPSGLATYPTATACVKPLLLSNTDPTGVVPTVFDTTSGAINPASTLLGSQVLLWSTKTGLPPSPPAPPSWTYTAGNTATSFKPLSSVACNGSSGFNDFQLAVAGCVQTPIVCNSSLNTVPTAVDTDTQSAVNCLTRAAATGGGDIQTISLNKAFEYLAGSENPAVQGGTLTANSQILVSDSLVTLPVYTGSATPGPATVVGFVQLFLYPSGSSTTATTPPGIPATVVNLVGCGSNAISTPTIYGNGPSAVPVRLITPPAP